MTETLIWLIVFAVILIMSLKSWGGGLGEFFRRTMPSTYARGHDDRWIWCIALAVVGATFIVNPISMLMTLLLLSLIIWAAMKIVRWGLSKAKTY